MFNFAKKNNPTLIYKLKQISSNVINPQVSKEEWKNKMVIMKFRMMILQRI